MNLLKSLKLINNVNHLEVKHFKRNFDLGIIGSNATINI
jgi:hypothetical protein